MAKAEQRREAAAGNLLFLPPHACPINLVPSGREIAFGGKIFGTSWMVRAILQGCADTVKANQRQIELKEKCQAALDLIDRQMSPWNEQSDLNRYNRLPDGSTASFPEPMAALVQCALSLHDLTGGAFDPLIGEVTDLWGFGPPVVKDGLPGDNALSALVKQRSVSRPVCEDGRLVRRQGYALDLCGIAKGYAVDFLTEIMRAEVDVASVLVEIGGELKGHGIKPGGMPWLVDLDWPNCGHDGMMRIALHGWACASSGSDLRFFDHGGQRFSHTMSPATAAPVQNDLRGVTVLDPNCWRADALATALLVLGLEDGMALADRHTIPCLLVPASNAPVHRPLLSNAMKEWLANA